MSDGARDLAVVLEHLATLVERVDPVSSVLRVADSLVDGSASSMPSLGDLLDLASSLGALVGHLHGIRDDVEAQIRTLAPHLARMAGSTDRLGGLFAVLADAWRTFGPIADALGRDGSATSGSGPIPG